MMIEATRPAMLLRKTGEPHAAISRSMVTVKRGRVKERTVFLRKKGMRASTAQMDMEMDVARAEPSTFIPQRPRKRDSRPIVKRDIKMFRPMLILTKPQMRR